MLPKPVRMFLLSAVLACTHARGAPNVNAGEGPSGLCEGGRIAAGADVAKFAGCRAVLGDLTVEGTDLSDLTALSELRAVTGALTIRNNAMLRSLRGLESLARVGSLVLRENGLYGTHGVEGLRQVGTLVIAGNRLLISLQGFRDLTHVDNLVVTHNPRVCAGLGLFPALSRVNRRLVVTSNLGLSQHDVAGLLARGPGDMS